MEVKPAHFDVAIVGAGPAGSSAAITAARGGLRVALLESGQFPRQKVCGEFVSAESLSLLRELLADSPDALRVLAQAPRIDRARLFLGERMVSSPISPGGLSLPRMVLDELLWRAAGCSGAVTHANCEVRSISGEGPFCLATPTSLLIASAVVIASGRWSRFSDKAHLPVGPKWIGIKAHYREPLSTLSTDLYFLRDGYCGVQPIGSGNINACAMVRSDRATSLDDIVALSPLLARRAATWELVSEPVSTAPLLYREPQPAHGNQLMVGDAAGFIDPFVGDGISIALRTGYAAATCLIEHFRKGSPLEDAAAAYREQYESQFAPLLAAAARIRRLLSLRPLAQKFTFEMLRVPGLVPFMARKTRQSRAG